MTSQPVGFIAICLSLTGMEMSLGDMAPVDTSDPVQLPDYTEWLQNWTQIEQAFLN